MKSIITVLLFLITLTIQAQEQNRTIAKLAFDEIVTIDNIELQFVKIISDSRCPKNVMCIRAGEAEVLVTIYENGKFLKQQKLTFYPIVNGNGALEVYTSSGLNISGMQLYPYPEHAKDVSPEDYFLELLIEG
jgi:hypothetical protein